jgi:hypothetical protein
MTWGVAVVGMVSEKLPSGVIPVPKGGLMLQRISVAPTAMSYSFSVWKRLLVVRTESWGIGEGERKEGRKGRSVRGVHTNPIP